MKTSNRVCPTDQSRPDFGIIAYPLEGLTESYEVDWFGSRCFNPSPRFDNAFPAVRSTSCWQTWSSISRDRIGSEMARGHRARSSLPKVDDRCTSDYESSTQQNAS